MGKATAKKTNRYFRSYYFKTIAISLFLFNCAKAPSQAVQSASESISKSLGCTNVKSKVFDAYYEMIDHEQFIPTIKNINFEIDTKLDSIFSAKNLSAPSAADVIALKTELHSLTESLLSESKVNPNITWKEQIQKLIEYEMEDQSHSKIINTTSAINQHFLNIKALSEKMDLPCHENSDPSKSENSALKSAPPGPGKMSIGTKMVFATAYQSCRVLDLPEMDRSTPSVIGISRVGTHPDGVGGKRLVTNLRAVQDTHYYIRGLASESNCVDVKNNPLIYDYGGEPFISGNTINFQKDAGTGTSALGVDCSAYISSAIAVAGLRYRPGVENKTIFIRQTSEKFINASLSGFTCFKNITVTPQKSIEPGDVVGVHGHVVTIDKIGTDPFGLKLLNSSRDCRSMDYKNFDITISQSSPSKNGIGINKYAIKDYLDESNKMRFAFLGMAEQACRAHFENKNFQPKNSDWGFIRHLGTSECLAPRVTMVGESCTQKCF